jgi:hypothetical protein
MKKMMYVVAMLAVGVVSVGLLTSCTSTSRMRNTKSTGFLGDYSQMRPDPLNLAQMVYINPRAKWATYNKIIIDPIKTYAIPGNPLAELPKEQLVALVTYLHAAAVEQLGQDYAIVQSPGPGVMRLRIAITEANANKPITGVMSSLTPPGIAISSLKTAATGSGLGTGSARVEIEVLDALTKERLGAGVDAQSGNKRDFFGSFGKWDDAQDAFDGWAVKLKERLASLRAGGK